jgi:hypothetical protein
MYKPPALPKELHGYHDILEKCITFKWMAEFNSLCVANLKTHIIGYTSGEALDALPSFLLENRMLQAARAGLFDHNTPLKLNGWAFNIDQLVYR